ncbi:MAG: endonuclease/exonuclease/phosphatase family protein [Pseudomonadota bacterium]|nr:endonuclease/exonuclease/phosphatase family protein [Pseudomonadota bacterium]
MPPPPSPLRAHAARVLWAHAWLVAVLLAALLLARLVAHDATWPLLVANQFSVWLYAPIWLVGLTAWVWQRRRLAIVATPVMLWHLSLLAPWLPRTPPPACGPALSVLSANLLMVHPAPAALAEEVFAADVDVVLLQELSPLWEAVLDDRGLFLGWPEGWRVVREDSFGSAILSRLPLDSAEELDVTGLPQTHATITWDGRTIALFNVHTLPPRTSEYAALHREGLDVVAAWVHAHAAAGEAFVLGGDLNAAPYSRFFRDIAGVADDAWDLAGHGFGFTWPNGIFPLPPTRLDHVIVSRDLTVTNVTVGIGDGSDHRPLRVEVAARCK